MYFTCDREVLIETLTRLNPVGKSTTKPILHNAIVTSDLVNAKKIMLAATNIDMSMQCTMHCVESSGNIRLLLNIEKTLKVLKESGSDQVEIRVDESMTYLKLDGSSHKMPLEMPHEYPEPTFDDDEIHGTISAVELQQIISELAPMTSSESAKFAMSGVLFRLWGDGGELVATNGKVMGDAKFGAPETPSDKDSLVEGLIPAAAIQALKPILSRIDGEAPVDITIRTRGAQFSTHGIKLTTRLVEGRFPPYGSIIPKQPKLLGIINREWLKQSVRQASALLDKETRRVTLEFLPGKLRISAKSLFGESDVVVSLEECTEEFRTIIDPFYLIPWIEQNKSGELAFHGTTPDRPMIATAANMLFLIMPLS